MRNISSVIKKAAERDFAQFTVLESGGTSAVVEAAVEESPRLGNWSPVINMVLAMREASIEMETAVFWDGIPDIPLHELPEDGRGVENKLAEADSRRKAADKSRKFNGRLFSFSKKEI